MADIVLRLYTSARSFTTWLVGRYLKGEFLLYVPPWVIQRPEWAGERGAYRVVVTAVRHPDDPDPSVRPAVGRHDLPPPQLPTEARFLRFDVSDIGTQRDAHAEVAVAYLSFSRPLRMHCYGVLKEILETWPEARQDLEHFRSALMPRDEELAAAIRSLEDTTRLAGQGPAAQGPAATDEGVSPPGTAQGPPPDPPWLKIPDHGWNRLAVELLHRGYTSAEIAQRTGRGITAKTVANRLSQLRAQHGPAVVPRRKDPPTRPRKLGTSGTKSGTSGY